MLYKYNGNKLQYTGIVGDGISDDTQALQEAINSNKYVWIPDGLKLRITQSINIDISDVRSVDFGGSTVIVDGGFTAFNINGSLVSGMSALPTTLTDGIKEDEASFSFRNAKIIGTAPDNTSSIGINVSGCFKTKIENCYIYNLSTGIAIENICRDLILTGNNIYAVKSYGIHMKPSTSLHQFNMVDNIISYCKYCIFFDNPEQIANWQCVGNDIEIATYPAYDLQYQRCIMIQSDSIKSGQLSEIEIVGNTIQGHDRSTDIIDINGGASRYIQLLSICGNHISNANNGSGVRLSKVNNVALNGNTFKSILNGACFNISSGKNIAITGNTFDTVASFVAVDAQSDNVSVVGNSGECSGTPISSLIVGNGFCSEANVINSSVN